VDTERLTFWLGQDLYEALVMLRSLVVPPGPSLDAVQHYLQFVYKADAFYDSIRPDIRQQLGAARLITKDGVSPQRYEDIEANFKIITLLDLSQWQLDPKSIYEYVTRYRPRLWELLAPEWSQGEAAAFVQILTEAPPPADQKGPSKRHI